VNHLLIHCEVTYGIWIAFFNCFGLSWVLPRLRVDMHAFWWTSGSPRSVAVCKMVPMCLL
jgi:hypothetical protein